MGPSPPPAMNRGESRPITYEIVGNFFPELLMVCARINLRRVSNRDERDDVRSVVGWPCLVADSQLLNTNQVESTFPADFLDAYVRQSVRPPVRPSVLCQLGITRFLFCPGWMFLHFSSPPSVLLQSRVRCHWGHIFARSVEVPRSFLRHSINLSAEFFQR